MQAHPFAAVLPALIAVAFWFYCLYDFSRTDERDLRVYSRQVWILWLVFGNLLGALLWYFQGRPPNARRR